MANLKSSQIPTGKGRRVEAVELWAAKNRVHKSGESFSKALHDIADKLQPNMKLFTKQTALRIYTGVVLGNPVDTGYSRVNWLFGTNPSYNKVGERPTVGTILERPLTGQASKSTGLSNTYFINNNLPYIKFLEGGSSNQAPTGFIANAIFRVSKQLQRLKG